MRPSVGRRVGNRHGTERNGSAFVIGNESVTPTVGVTLNASRPCHPTAHPANENTNEQAIHHPNQ